MSDREFQGYVNVSQDTGQIMFTLRANLASTKIRAAIKLATGVVVPKRGTYKEAAGCTLAWMSSDELLIMASIAHSEKLWSSLDVALSEQHFLLEDVSDARAKFILRGTEAREVLAKLAPMDTHPAKFLVGSFNRTRFAQVAGAVFLEQDDLISVICFRSVQDYVYALFCEAAACGSEVLVRE